MSDDKRRPGGEHGPGSASRRGDAQRCAAHAKPSRRRSDAPHSARPFRTRRLLCRWIGFRATCPPLIVSGRRRCLGVLRRPASRAGHSALRHRARDIRSARFSSSCTDQGLGAPGLGVLSPPMPRERGPVRAPDGAALLARSYTCSAGSRDYRLYVPAAGDGQARPSARRHAARLHADARRFRRRHRHERARRGAMASSSPIRGNRRAPINPAAGTGSSRRIRRATAASRRSSPG